jgi:hypothetical protein
MATREVVIHVQDVQDRFINIEVDDKLTNDGIKKHIEDNFYTRGLKVLSNEDGETQTQLYGFTPDGVDEDGDDNELIEFNEE